MARTDSRDEHPAVVWFRRDLRLSDNPAWAAATGGHSSVLAVFVREPNLVDVGAAGPFRAGQLVVNLDALDVELGRLGGRLCVVDGPAEHALPRLVASHGASRVYANADVSPFSRSRDDRVRGATPVEIVWSYGSLVHEPGAVLTKQGTLSQVFTPFYREWERTPLSDWPEPRRCTVIEDAGTGIPPEWQALAAGAPISGGEREASRRLRHWLGDVDRYGQTHDAVAVDGTSQLSIDLKFGTLAGRTVLDAVGETTPGRSGFVRQLAWRDWYAHLLMQHPKLVERAMRPEYDAIAWRDDDEGFMAWCHGRTGFPIVDAGMRQLASTGWMHNRARMITASFLVKDLLIDWRRGERHFRYLLADGDTAQNVGNWQWVAGTGPDAAPYFRIFNPVSQGRKFDPDGDYVRRWIPELANLDRSLIHAPWEGGPLDLAAAGVTLGVDYPYPIVDHAAARERALAAYSDVRSSRRVS
ncbi:MAG: deoxyribodipyrimidine photo-lyase [Acidimicrobiia bacterium]